MKSPTEFRRTVRQRWADRDPDLPVGRYRAFLLKRKRVEHDIDSDAAWEAYRMLAEINLNRWPEEIRWQVRSAREAVMDAARALVDEQWGRYEKEVQR